MEREPPHNAEWQMDRYTEWPRSVTVAFTHLPTGRRAEATRETFLAARREALALMLCGRCGDPLTPDDDDLCETCLRWELETQDEADLLEMELLAEAAEEL